MWMNYCENLTSDIWVISVLEFVGLPVFDLTLLATVVTWVGTSATPAEPCVCMSI